MGKEEAFYVKTGERPQAKYYLNALEYFRSMFSLEMVDNCWINWGNMKLEA